LIAMDRLNYAMGAGQSANGQASMHH